MFWNKSTRGTQFKPPHITTLIAMAAIGPMAMNIFIPSIPGLMKVFHTSYNSVQLVLTVYLISMAGAQLLVGPLSDRFGRRPVVLWGTGFCFLGTIICVFANQIEVLVLGRILQAIGACTGLVMSRTIIRDMHGMERAASMIAYVTMAMVVVPMFAPTLGGVLDNAYGWRASFVFVCIYVFILFVCCFYLLGETHKGPFVSSANVVMITNYLSLMGSKRFNFHALQVSFSSAAFFSFLGGSPYVVIELMESSEAEYGFYFIIAGGAYMLGNLIAGRYSEKLGIKKCIFFGTLIGLFGGIVLTSSYLLNILTPISLFFSMGIIAVGNGICLPSGNSAAISADPEKIGTAAGLVGFLQMGFGACGAYLTGLFLGDTAEPLVIVMFSSVFLAFLINLIGQKFNS